MLTNLVGAHRRNINTKFEANPCRGSREEVKNWILYTADWKVIYVHDSLKIVGNSVSNVQIAFISSDLLRSSLLWHYLFWLLPVFDLGL